MDVINKLYSSVSSTVSQLSGVLPGNPVTREYEAEKQIASGGRGLHESLCTTMLCNFINIYYVPHIRSRMEDLQRL